MAFFYLLIAIIAEVIATSALKASNGFSVLWPSLTTFIGYAIAIYFLSQCHENHSYGDYLCPVVRCRHCLYFFDWMGGV